MVETHVPITFRWECRVQTPNLSEVETQFYHERNTAQQSGPGEQINEQDTLNNKYHDWRSNHQIESTTDSDK